MLVLIYMNNNLNLPEDIEEIFNKVKTIKKFTHENIKLLKKNTFALKLKYATNERLYRIIENIESNLDEENRNLSNMKMTIISALGTIFLPLSFIVGYFGMNFNSMGNPTLKRGILATKHVDKFILSLSLFCIVIVSIVYYYNF